jgi:RNA-directed DNA polymerase
MESENVYTKQQRIATLAAMHREVSFTSMAYHVDVQWLKEAYRRTRKDGAVGIDAMSAEEYEVGLDERLSDLLERFKSGAYYAPPVRRVYIPKDGKDGEKRPIGIPTLEDKILQRAVLMLLEPLFETDFSESSYGFRPKRSPHQALEALWKAIMGMGKSAVVLEIDIKGFFDTLKHEHLREALRRRVCDGVITRIVGKWLKAGIVESGAMQYPEEGCPQGGVISPLLSNIYLHEVLDVWFEQEIAKLLTGKAKLVRFADDAVIVFEHMEDAQRVRRVISKRFAKYGLELHPEKTRLITFNKPEVPGSKTETFDFLGFTHYWTRSFKGHWVVRRKTSKKRLKRAILRTYEWCKEHRHDTVKEQWRTLNQKIRGHYQYYSVTSNIQSLKLYLNAVVRAWHKWLGRRSRDNQMPWEKMKRLLKRYPLLQPKIYHSCA